MENSTPDPIPENPVPKKLNRKLIPTFGAVILLILTGAGIIIFNKNRSNKEVIPLSSKNQNNNKPIAVNSTSVPANIAEPIIIRKRELPAQEVKSAISLQDDFLIYAIKTGRKVVVIKKNMQDGSEEEVFSYMESVSAEHSGNTWHESVPSLDYYERLGLFAYSDSEGLKLYHLGYKESRVLIKKLSQDNDQELRCSTWSVKGLVCTYDLIRPRWSQDGRYISFNQTHYEGTSIGIFDTQTESYQTVKAVDGGLGGYGVSISSRWSPVENVLLEPGNFGGVYVSVNPINPGMLRMITAGVIEGESETSASFSPDGKKIAFVYNDNKVREELGGGANKLAIISTDGKGFKVLDQEKYRKNSPFFSPEGSSIFFLQNKPDRQVLMSYDLLSGKTQEIMNMPAEIYSWNEYQDAAWTKDGYLLLTGITYPKKIVGFDEKTQKMTSIDIEAESRIILLDVEAAKTLYVSPKFNDTFISTLGVTN